MEGLGRPTQCLAEALRAHGHDHELLKIDVRIGMRATVQYVEHRRGKHAGVHAAQVAIERNLQCLRHGAGRGHRNSQNCIRTELALIRRSIERDHRLVNEPLIGRVHAFELRRNHRLHIGYGLQHAFAEVVALIAVAQLNGLMLAR